MSWRQSVIDYIRAEAQPADKFGHQPRLYALAADLGADVLHDDDVLFAAAWMHDLGVFVGHRPSDPAHLAKWNHVPYTVARTRELLTTSGFPIEKLDLVASTIETHQPQDNPTTPEGILLRDADILEQLGAVGILRSVVKVGRDTRYPSYTQIIPVLQRASEQLPGKLRLERSRQLAVPRIEILRAFLAAVESEAGELLH